MNKTQKLQGKKRPRAPQVRWLVGVRSGSVWVYVSELEYVNEVVLSGRAKAKLYKRRKDASEQAVTLFKFGLRSGVQRIEV